LNDSFVRAKPAELLFVGHLLLPDAKPRHNFFDIVAFEMSRVKLCGLTNKLSALSQLEGKA
jgi:hypothetical protein